MDFGFSAEDAASAFPPPITDNFGGSNFMDRAIRPSPSQDIEEALRAMNAAADDPARAYHYADLIRTLAPNVFDALLSHNRDRQAIPFPPFGELLHLQLSLFDNWKPFGFEAPRGKGRGARKHRLVLGLEAWKTSFRGGNLTKHNRHFAASAPVLGAGDVARYLDNIPAFGKPKGDWIAYREKLIAGAREHMLVAPLYNVTRGNGGYMLDHYIAIPEPEHVASRSTDLAAVLICPEGMLPITGFVGHIAKKPSVPLDGNVVLSARLSTDSSNPWRSGDLVTSIG